MTLPLTPEKLMKMTSHCLEMYKTQKVFVLQFCYLHNFSFGIYNKSGRIAQSRSFIPTSSNLEFQWKTGTSLVGPKRKTVQWKMSCST